MSCSQKMPSDNSRSSLPADAPHFSSKMASSSTTIDMLPDDLLVMIFQRLDAVSQKRAERVCYSWKTLLRDKGYMPKKHVTVDINVLGNPDPEKPNCIQSRIFRSVFHVLEASPLAETLRITDKSTSWTSADVTVEKTDRILLTIPVHSGETPLLLRKLAEYRHPRLRGVVFENLVVEARYAMHFIHILRQQINPVTSVQWVEFRNVKVHRLSLARLNNEYGTEKDDEELVRMANGRVNVGNADYTVKFISLFASHDSPLTEEELEHYRQTVFKRSPWRPDLTNVCLRVLLDRFSGQRRSIEEILDGSALPPFWARMLMLRRNNTPYWNSVRDDIHGTDEDHRWAFRAVGDGVDGVFLMNP